MAQAGIPDGGLRNSLIISLCLHIALLLLLYFGLPHLFKPPVAPWHPIPVDIVEIADITNTRIKPDNTPKPPQPVAKPPTPTPPAPTPPQPPAPTPPQPEPPKPQQTPTPPTPQEAEALPKPVVKPKPPEPKPVPKPAVDPLASVLKDVAKLKPSPPKAQDAKPVPQPKQPEQEQPQQEAPSLSQRLTMSEEDAVREQIRPHWDMPIGARDAQNLTVELLITVNPDRTVQNVEIVDQSRLATDSYFRAAAEAAVRAVRMSSPLLLPPDKYEQRKTIRFNFDPRDML